MTSWSTSMWHGWCKAPCKKTERPRDWQKHAWTTSLCYENLWSFTAAPLPCAPTICALHVEIHRNPSPHPPPTLRLRHRMAIATLTPMYSAFLWRSACMLFPRLRARDSDSHWIVPTAERQELRNTKQNLRKRYVKVAAPETCLKGLKRTHRWSKDLDTNWDSAKARRFSCLTTVFFSHSWSGGSFL